MKRKILILTLCMLLAGITTGFADKEVSVTIDGRAVNFDCQPTIENDRVMVPVRTIFEELGASVSWEQGSQTVSAGKNNELVVLKINSDTMLCNGRVINLDAAPTISSDRTLVPLRAISEAFGATVLWDGDSCSVSITTDGNSGESAGNTGSGTENGENAEETKSDFAAEVVRLVNVQRASAGLSPVTLNSGLCTVAKSHSEDMGSNGFMSHTGSNGSSPFDRIKAGGISYRAAGENVAAGQSSPEEVMNGWMQSEGHRSNILNPDFKEIGVGYYKTDSGYRHYWTQCFIG